MNLSDSDILQFQAMCKEHGIELDWRESQEQATRLVWLMRSVYKPMTHDEYALFNNEYEYFNEHERPKST